MTLTLANYNVLIKGLIKKVTIKPYISSEQYQMKF